MGWGHHLWGLGRFGGLGGWEVLIGILMMVLFWGGLFAVLYFVVRAAVGGRRDQRENSPNQEALRILSERYAKGEITSEEFREMKETLRT